MISVGFQGKTLNITVIQVYIPTTNIKKLFNFSFLGISGWGIDLDYYDVEWFALEMNQDHSVIFEGAPKYCISDSC